MLFPEAQTAGIIYSEDNKNAEVATGLSSNMGKESGSELKVEQKDNDLEM